MACRSPPVRRSTSHPAPTGAGAPGGAGGGVIATIVDTTVLSETVVAAFVAGVGTTIVFSLAILGATRSPRRNATATVSKRRFSALTVVGLLATGRRFSPRWS